LGVERSNGVYQDRLVKELRLAGISDIARANELLYGGFIDEMNSKFAVEPRQEADYHRSAEGYDLAQILSIQEQRAISEDWVVRFENNYYQLERQSKRAPAKAKVNVSRRLDGRLQFYYRGKQIGYNELADRPAKRVKEKRAYKEGVKPEGQPKPQHPWRRIPWSRKERGGSRPRPSR